MGHTVGEQAGRSVKKSEKTRLLERTPEQIIKDIRNNLSAKLAVTPDDVKFLLGKYDEAVTLGEALVASKWVDAVPVSQWDALLSAVKQIYNAAIWTADRPVDAQTLWTSIRDAAGFEPGNSPQPIEVNVEYHVPLPPHVGEKVVGIPTGFDEAPTLAETPVYDFLTGETTDAKKSE